MQNLKSKSPNFSKSTPSLLERWLNSPRIPRTLPSHHPLILSSRSEIQKATRLAKSVLSQDIPSMKDLFLLRKKSMIFKLIPLMPVLTVAVFLHLSKVNKGFVGFKKFNKLLFQSGDPFVTLLQLSFKFCNALLIELFSFRCQFLPSNHLL